MVKSRYGLNFLIHEQEGLYPNCFLLLSVTSCGGGKHPSNYNLPITQLFLNQSLQNFVD